MFAMVIKRLMDDDRQESPWTMMFEDDIVICGESRWRNIQRGGGTED